MERLLFSQPIFISIKVQKKNVKKKAVCKIKKYPKTLQNKTFTA